jgi:uncharacterized alpha-E superfamily protein
MLSRIADSIYWMSRYLQRAGDTARLMDINMLYLLEAEEDMSESDKWRPLLQITSAEGAYTALYGDDQITEERILQFMTAERSNGNSIRTCVRLARENARIARDRISKEMWEAINELWLSVDQRLKSPLHHLKASHFFSFVRNETARFSGLTSNTMMRGEAFGFYSMGAFIEQADMTARILDVKYHILLPDLNLVGSALDYYQWSALLKSLSGYEAFRRKYHAGFRPIDVVEFTIFELEFPRSLAFSVERIRRALETTGTSKKQRSREATERLSNLLTGNSAEQIFSTGLHEFLEEFLAAISDLNQAVQADFLDVYTEEA